MVKGKVAIYMCCYNHEKFVAEAIESVLNQTYTNWEFWIANDGSTDNSAEIIKLYKDKRIHFFNFEKNTKLVGAQTLLLDKIKDSDCEYIVGTASDDKWTDDRLEKQVTVLNTNPEYGACFSWDEVIFSTEKSEVESWVNPEYSHIKNMSRYEWLRTMIIKGNLINACSAMVRKDIYFEVGGYNQYFIRLGDYRLWLNILMKYPVYMVEEPLVYYRRHDNNISKVNLDTVIGVHSEDYYIKEKLFEQIDSKLFFRILYEELIFDMKSAKDYDADKIFFFMFDGTDNKFVAKQLVIKTWLNNSENKYCMDRLKEKYEMDNGLFTKIKSKCGLGVLLSYFFDELGDLFKFENPSFEGFFANRYSKYGLSMESIKDYICNPFYRLAYCVEKNNLGKKSLKILTNDIYKLRKSILDTKECKVMHIICNAEFENDAYAIINDIKDDYKIYLSFVLSRQDYFAGKEINVENVENAEYIELYDKKYAGLHFGKELGIEADIIYYIDCLGDDFECTSMIRGINLGITQIGLIDKRRFSDEVSFYATSLVIGNVDCL